MAASPFSKPPVLTIARALLAWSIRRMPRFACLTLALEDVAADGPDFQKLEVGPFLHAWPTEV